MGTARDSKAVGEKVAGRLSKHFYELSFGGMPGAHESLANEKGLHSLVSQQDRFAQIAAKTDTCSGSMPNIAYVLPEPSLSKIC